MAKFVVISTTEVIEVELNNGATFLDLKKKLASDYSIDITLVEGVQGMKSLKDDTVLEPSKTIKLYEKNQKGGK